LRGLDVTGSEEKRWGCSACAHQLNKSEIENRLIKEAERASLAFILQDMRCAQTHRVSMKICTAISDMSAPLVMDTPPEVLHSQMDIFMRIARFYKFEFLETVISDLVGTGFSSE
jgi:hypothetical protein